jgi:hypothetical protein
MWSRFGSGLPPVVTPSYETKSMFKFDQPDNDNQTFDNERENLKETSVLVD